MSPTSNRPMLESSRSIWPALRVTTAAFVFILWEVAFSSAATAQVVAKSKDDKPPAIDKRPLARYVSKDKLLLLIESDGLEANADAWKKTAAYRLLNETSLGEMLEAMLTQLSDRLLKFSPIQKLSGADITKMVKHAANHGFVLAVVGDDKGPKPVTHAVAVFRGGYAVRESRPLFSRLMGTMMGASKFASIKKGARTVAQVTPASGVSWIWWPEQGDLVIAENAEAVIATIDGKTPNAIDHPLRSTLVKTDAGFTPFGMILVDPSAAGSSKSDTVAKVENALAEWGVTRVDFRWGAQDDALMSLARLQAQKPRKGALAIVDQPTFDRTKLLPLPAAIESYSALSMDANSVLDAILPSLPPLPPQAETLTEGIASLESKSRVDLRKNILGRIGPKMVAYVMPGSAPSRTVPEGTAKPDSNPLSAMIGIPLPGMATFVFPRFTVLAEVKDLKGLESDLDKLMVAVNKEFKAKAEEAEKALEAAERTPGRPGGFGGRGGQGGFGGPGGRRPPGPIVAPEFKLMTGKEKAYVLSMPADQVKQLPAGFRPTVRLGEKYLVLAANPEAARLALEAKEGGYTPPADVAASLDRLPKDLVYLNVHDPRATEPELLSTLPGSVQGAVNALLSIVPPPTTPSATTEPGNAAAGGAPPGVGVGAVGGGEEGGARRGGGKKGEGLVGAGAGGPPPGAQGFGQGGAPGFAQGGASGPPGGNRGMMGAGPGGPAGAKKPDPKVSPFFFDIETSLLPSADEIKTRLFPMVWAVYADDKEVVIQSRGAFPNPVSKEMLSALTFGIPLGKAMQQGGVPPESPPGSIGGPGGFPPGQGRPPGAAQGRQGGGGSKFEDR